MEVQDVPAICALARERGIVTLIDNTWATPLLFPAIAAGRRHLASSPQPNMSAAMPT